MVMLAAMTGGAALSAGPELEWRWVYLPTNLLVDKNVDEGDRRSSARGQRGLQRRGADGQQIHALGPAAGALRGQRPPIRQAIRELKLACIVGVCPIGYSNDLLGRDANLAEGLPVRDAPFVADEGSLVAADDGVRMSTAASSSGRRTSPSAGASSISRARSASWTRR